MPINIYIFKINKQNAFTFDKSLYIWSMKVLLDTYEPLAMTFIEVLESKHKWIIEAIEHGSSDPQIIEDLKTKLFNETGYKYKSI